MHFKQLFIPSKKALWWMAGVTAAFYAFLYFLIRTSCMSMKCAEAAVTKASPVQVLPYCCSPATTSEVMVEVLVILLPAAIVYVAYVLIKAVKAVHQKL